MKNVVLLGASGSIGTQSLDVLRRFPDEFRLVAATVDSNVAALKRIADEFHPKAVGVRDELAAQSLFCSISGAEIFSGDDAASICASYPEADIVINAVAGFAGIYPFLAALKAGKTVAAVNKESIVCSHDILKIDGALAGRTLPGGAKVIPVDSEQSAIFACMGDGRGIRQLLLTASGGPFFGKSRSELERISPEDALKHPTWSMGKKITIDSATMFNKGLELIEAAYLFDSRSIEVLVHPQSIVHSMVEFDDGSVMAQLYNPDMRIPIQYALTIPGRLDTGVKRLSLDKLCALEFHAVSDEPFKSIALAREALRCGGAYPIAYNAANEVAVERFLAGDIGFLDIFDCVDEVLSSFHGCAATSIELVEQADIQARKTAGEFKSA